MSFTNDILTRLAAYNSIRLPLYNKNATYTFNPNTSGINTKAAYLSANPNIAALLSSFNTTNTTGIYPELRKIKLLVLNATKNGSNTVAYTTTSPVAGYFSNILAELRKLFPNMFIDYTPNSNSISDASNNTFFVSNRAVNGQLVFSYTKSVTGTESLTPSDTNLPFTFLTNAFTLVNSSVSINTSTSTVTLTINTFYNNTTTTTSDFGLTFSGKSFFTNNSVSNINIITLTNIPLSKEGSQFANLTTLTIATGQNPVIRSETSLASCFSGCTNFNSNIGGWNTAGVNNMSNMFQGAVVFSADTITNWNLGNITSSRFCSFVGQLIFSFTTRTSTPSTSPSYTFILATYDSIQPLTPSAGNFTSSSLIITTDTGLAVTSGNLAEDITYNYTFNTSYTMNYNSNFGLKFNTDNINWLNANTTGLNITRLFNIPLHNSGNQFSYTTGSTTTGFTIPLTITTGQNPIIRPNTSLSKCFARCTNFNSDISSWNTINVNNMATMFQDAFLFNQNIGGWNTSNVRNMDGLFLSASNFNNGGGSDGVAGPAFNWNTSAVEKMSSMFRWSGFNCDISRFVTTNVTDMSFMFQGATKFNQQISYVVTPNYWNTSNVTNIARMLDGATIFNNGQNRGQTGNPLNWRFTFTTSYQYENWRLNSGLSNDNAKVYVNSVEIILPNS